MKELTLIDKAFLLKKSPLFSSIDIDLLLTISDQLESEFYKKGSKVFEIGQDAARIYLIAEGHILIQDHQRRPLEELSSLEVFGDEALLNGKKRAYDALCLSETLLLSLSKSHFLAILGEFPSVAIHFLEAYSINLNYRRKT